MTTYDWNETARGFAEYAKQFRRTLARGAAALQVCVDPPEAADGLPLILGVFESGAGGLMGALEVELLRRRLQDESLDELGFAVSADGSTWAMLIGADPNSCHTEVGRTFRRELLKGLLDDTVWGLWRYLNAASESLKPEDAPCQAQKRLP